jgi:protein TonB
MFEDSTFESAGRIRTRSRRWMMAALLLNGSILLTLVLIPLIYPEALPRAMMNILLEAPAPPPQQLHPVQQAVTRVSREAPEMLDGHIFAPPKIPISIRMINTPEPPGGNTMPGMAELGGPGIPGAIFPGHSQPPRVRQAVTGPVRLPSSLVAGLLVSKVLPAYPQIAKAARRQGVIVLQATISRTGTIENLRVISGDPMLQQAALESVSHWRYRPYLLNGQPVEVETTVNVIFRLTE